MHMTASDKAVQSSKNVKARSERYAQAMAAMGRSRVVELAPIATHAAAAKGAMLDMMSGTGFVSQYLCKPFDSIHAIDRMTASMPEEAPVSRYFECDVTQADMAELIGCEYDAIISLAGFHHLLPEKRALSHERQIAAYRVNCLKQWRTLLKDGGRLVLADVPAPGQFFSQEALRETSDIGAFPHLRTALAKLPAMPFCEHRDSKPEPACFFDEFVARESITPHIAFFETESSLSLLLKRAGFTNIRTGIHFTPWYFQNLNQSAWFTHNLFGIGTKQYDSPSSMPRAFLENIHRAVNTHLSTWPADDGGFWIGWKLLYASAENNG